MSAILQPLITTLDIKPLNDDESFTTLLKQQNNAFFKKWVNHHDDLHTLYTVLCFKLSHDLSFQKKAALSEDNKDELRAALLLAELLEYLYSHYLDIKREAVKLRREQTIYCQLLQKNPPKAIKLKPDTFSQAIRNTTGMLNSPRLSLIRSKRVIDMTLPLLMELKALSRSILLFDRVTNPLVAGLACVFFLPQLLTNLFILAKHVIPGSWMDKKERELGIYVRLIAQLKRRWVEIFNDIPWIFAGVVNLCVALGRISPYFNLFFFVYDIGTAAVRFGLEMSRLNRLEKRFQAVDSLDSRDKTSFQAYFAQHKRFEAMRLGITLTNTIILAFAMVMALPVFAISPWVPLAAAIILLSSTVGSYIALQVLEKKRLKRGPTLFNMPSKMPAKNQIPSRLAAADAVNTAPITLPRKRHTLRHPEAPCAEGSPISRTSG